MSTRFLPGIESTIPVKCVAEFHSAKGVQRVPFTAHFERLTVTQIRAAGDILGKGDIAETDDLILSHLQNITGLKLASGDDAEFSRELVEEMLQYIEYRNALVKGLAESTTGRKISEGNS